MNIKKFTSLAIIITIVSLNLSSYASAFSDTTSNDWYYDYVIKLASAGVIDGSKLTFDPSSNVTRDVAAKVILKATGYLDINLLNPPLANFNDVPKSTWAYPYIETAKSKGFISGYTDGNYNPSNDINRAEFASMIIRAFDLKNTISTASNFNDVKTDDWFFGAVMIAKQNSIISGYAGNIFKPQNPINRAEMSKMIVSAMKIVEKKADAPINDPVENDNISLPPKPDPTTDPIVEPVVDPIVEPVVDPAVDPAVDPIVDPVTPPAPTTFTEDFSNYSNKYYNDGETFGPWLVQFNGYGTVGIESDTNNSWLHLSPQIADAPEKTQSSLVTGPAYQGAIQFQANIITESQLRTGSTPNAWEVAWMVWNYSDNEHFYYFIPKPNGWELGKRDPNYTGGQRFLATGSDTLFPINNDYEVKIEQDNSNKITVWVNGIQITSFTDTQSPYNSGKIGIYTEDAHIRIDNIITD